MEMNRLLVFSAVALMAIVSLRAERRAYHIAAETALTDTTIVFPELSPRPLSTVVVRAALIDPPRLRAGLSPSSLDVGVGELALRLQTFVTVNDDIDDGRVTRLTLLRADSVIASADCRDLSHPPGAFNTFTITFEGDSLFIGAGRGEATPRFGVSAQAPSSACTLSARGRADVALLLVEETSPSLSERLAGLPPEAIGEAMAGAPAASPAAYYTYLDREADPAVARLGGRYRLAVVPDPSQPGRFLILYISGAEVEPSLWSEGMLKGCLTPTPFAGQYDLQWFDAHGIPVPGADDSFALFDPEARILSFRFPLLEATLRFSAIEP